MARHRLMGGKREVGGASLAGHGPRGAQIINEYRLITTTNTNFILDLNTPWAKGPANYNLIHKLGQVRAI